MRWAARRDYARRDGGRGVVVECDGCAGDGAHVPEHFRDGPGVIAWHGGPTSSVCPACSQREHWAQDVIRAFRATQTGLPVSDVVHRPTDALIDGVLTLDAEFHAIHSEEVERSRRDAEKGRR